MLLGIEIVSLSLNNYEKGLKCSVCLCLVHVASIKLTKISCKLAKRANILLISCNFLLDNQCKQYGGSLTKWPFFPLTIGFD